MKTVRLANILKTKYNLKVVAVASPAQLLKDAKKEITLAYKYHFSEQAKEPVLQLIAQQFHEPWTIDLVNSMTELTANLDEYTPEEIFERVNKILFLIKSYKSDPDNKVRNFIHDSVKIQRQSDVNYREQLKSKFETALRATSGLLNKAAQKLSAFLPKHISPISEMIEQQRKELSRDKLHRFMMTPIAVSYGLNNDEIMRKILEDPILKQKLTTIINAIDRGHKPIDEPEIIVAVKELSDIINQKITTNESFFDRNIEPITEFDQEDLPQKTLKEEYNKKQQEEERQKLEELIKKRDEAHRQKMIEEDRSRHVRSEGVLKLLDRLLLKGAYENS